MRIAPGARLHLAKIDPDATPGAPGDRERTEAVTEELQDQLDVLQQRLWAEGKQSLLVVLQAMDAAGKDGTIRHVFRGLNPQGVRVAGFKVPTPIELAHDFLWRVHAQTPAGGEITIFNRSHYEDVLVVRVHEIVPPSVWKARYEQIREFEELLAARGTAIVKLFLHISQQEQRERFAERKADPAKRWKYRAADEQESARWPEYMSAYEDAISKTSTDLAPWYVIPSNRKWFRNWAASTILHDTLTAMNPKFPPPEAP